MSHGQWSALVFALDMSLSRWLPHNELGRVLCECKSLLRMVCVSRCASPPLVSAGRYFDIVVSVSGVPSTYTQGQWTYQPPTVTSVSPSRLPSVPATGAVLMIVGANFGVVPGTVTVGDRLAACDAAGWSDAVITCVAPKGVLPAAAVVVTAGS